MNVSSTRCGRTSRNTAADTHATAAGSRQGRVCLSVVRTCSMITTGSGRPVRESCAQHPGRCRPLRGVTSHATGAPVDDRAQGDPAQGDRALWDKASGGDEAAFSELFERHAEAVWNHAYRLTGSWSAAEDLTSNTFLTAWRRRADVTLIRDSALPWLYTVAGNAARDEYRGAS